MPSGRATGFELGQASRGEVSRGTSSRPTPSPARRCGCPRRRAPRPRRGMIWVLEAALGDGPRRPDLGRQARSASVSLRVMPYFVGDPLGTLELGGELVVLEVALRHRLAEPGLGAGEGVGADGKRLMFSTPHASTTSSAPEPIRLYARLTAYWRRPALRVDGGAGHVLDAAVRQPRRAGDVHRLGADLVDAPADDLADLVRRHVAALRNDASTGPSTSAGWAVASEPPRLPIAERPASTITTSRMQVLHRLRGTGGGSVTRSPVADQRQPRASEHARARPRGDNLVLPEGPPAPGRR